MENVLSILGAIAAPALGLAIRASRRNRLRQRALENLELAGELEPHDAAAADSLRRVAAEAAALLAARDEAWLRARFDPGALAALILLVAPALGLLFAAWDWDSGWRVPAIVAALSWAAVWSAVGLSQLWKEHESARASED